MPNPLTPQWPDATPPDDESTAQPPAPLPYHVAVRDHFMRREPKLWQWFHERETPDELRENVRLELLKSAVRLERTDREELYTIAGEVAARVGVTADITLYQAQSGAGMNAGLCFAPGEIHVVFHGPILSRLDADELRALLGHEFTHYSFLDAHGGEYRTVLAILDASTSAADAEFVHLNTARHFDLYTEILCDRGAMQAAADALPAVATLVKTTTGLEEVNAESYIRQAEEIFAEDAVQAEGGSHPETFIRARALALYADRGAAAEDDVRAMIEGARRLDELDLLGQVAVSSATRQLICYLLGDDAWRAESHVAQAHLYFDDWKPASDLDAALVAGALRCDDEALRDYYCYVVIDFVAVDRDVLEPALSRGLGLFARLGQDERLADLAGKELGLKKKEMAKIRAAVAMPEAGEESGEGSDKEAAS